MLVYRNVKGKSFKQIKTHTFWSHQVRSPAQKNMGPILMIPGFSETILDQNRLENPTSQPSKHHSRCIFDRSESPVPSMTCAWRDRSSLTNYCSGARRTLGPTVWHRLKTLLWWRKKTGSFFFGGTWLGHEMSYPCDIQFQIAPHLGSRKWTIIPGMATIIAAPTSQGSF